MRTVELAQLGWKQQQIAVALGVSESAVSDWLAKVQHDGPSALRSHPAPGRPPRLSREQLPLVPDFLWHGPEAYGFRGNVWTYERVVGVLYQEFGISYSKSQVSRLLKRLGWTPRIPITRAIQRDEAAIEHWRSHVWPALRQQAGRDGFTLVFVDESGFYLLPSVVKTYAPRGVTPVLNTWQTRDHLSVMGAVTGEGKVYSLVRDGSLNGRHTIEFLSHLMRLVGKRLLVIWDRSPIHRRAEVQAFLAQPGCRDVHVDYLPPYAPDLTPQEWCWEHLKEVELRNLSCLDVEQLHMELHIALGRVRQRTALVRSSFEAAGLNI